MSLADRLRQALAPAISVEKEVGRGAMGIVFLGHDPTLDRRVAIKVLRPEIATAVTVERFFREARMLARLRHPNVVQVYQAGTTDGLLYFVMDYVEGETLASALNRGPLDPSVALTVGRELLDALAAAHRHGIVHRDVKPANIFLSQGRLMLGDFGIARSATRSEETGLTLEGGVIGTPAYMAPEQIAGEPATMASDIYAAGLVLFECLTGRRWLPGQAPEHGDWSGIPPQAAATLKRALQPDPVRRWSTAAEMLTAFIGPTAFARWGWVAATVLAVAGLGFWALLRPAADATSRPVLVIQPFQASSTVERALSDSLIGELAGILAGHTDIAIRRGRGAQDDAPLRLEGWVGTRGRQIQVVARLVSDGRREEVGMYTQPAGSWREVADSLINDLLVLVMGLEDWDLPRDALPHTPTGMAAWTRAERFYLQALWDSAQLTYARAEELDSTCLLCSYRINDVQRWLEQERDPARVARVRRGASRFPVKYRMLIAADSTPMPARLDLLRRATEEYRDFYVAHYLLAEELFHRGPLYGESRTDARLQFAAAIGAAPDFAPPWYDLALLQISDGDSAGAREGLGRVRRLPAGYGLGLAQRVLVEVAYTMRFGPVEVGVQQTRAALGDSALLLQPATPAGPRLLTAFGTPQGALVLGMAYAEFRTMPTLVRSGLIAQLTARAALGQVDELVRAAARLRDEFPAPAHSRLGTQLGVMLALFDDRPSPDGDAAVRRGLEALAVGDREDRMAAAWMLGLLAYQRNAVRASEGHLRALRDEPAPRPRAALLEGWRRAAGRDFEGAIAGTDTWMGDDALIEGDDYGDPFLRAAFKLSRAEWQTRLGHLVAARRELRWHMHLNLRNLPVDLPVSAEVDWALATLAAWRAATLPGLELDRETCAALATVARNWAAGDTRYRVRADSARVRTTGPPCGDRP